MTPAQKRYMWGLLVLFVSIATLSLTNIDSPPPFPVRLGLLATSLIGILLILEEMFSTTHAVLNATLGRLLRWATKSPRERS